MKGSLLCGAVLLTQTLMASPIINDPVGLASPAVVITFDEVVLPGTTPLTTQYAWLGVTFSGLFYDTVPIGLGSFVAPNAQNFSSTEQRNPFSLFFSVPQIEVAFSFVGPDSTFTALLGGSVVETFSSPAAGGAYWGFTTLTPFDEIRVDVGDSGAAIDNLQLGAPVPEPASVTLLACGLIAVGFIGRQRPRFR